MHLLGRRRLLSMYSLVHPAIYTATSASIFLWPAIIANAEVKRLLQVYKGFRGDIKISVQSRAAAGIYGCFSVHYTYGVTPLPKDAFSARTWICDISSSEGVEFVIPFRHMYNYLTFPGNPSYYPNYVVLQLNNWCSLALDGGSSTLELGVFFSLENVDTGLYTDDNVVDLQSKHMGLGDLGSAVTAAALAVDVGSTLFSAWRTSVSGSVGATSAPAQLEYKPAITAAGKGKGVRHAFYGDLSTLTDDSTVPTLDVSDIPPGIVDSGVLCTSDGDYKFKDLGKIPGLRAIIQVTSNDPQFHTACIPIGLDLNKVTKLTGDIGNRSWAAFYGRYFRYYRGTHRIVINWHTSPLVAMRIRATFRYFTTDVTGLILPITSNEQPNEIVLVKGSLVQVINIPFHQLANVRACDHPIGNLCIQVLNPPSRASISDTLVLGLVTHSVHDLEFYSPQHGWVEDFTDPVLKQPTLNSNYGQLVQKQSDIRAVHDAPCIDYLGNGTPSTNYSCHMYCVDTLGALLRRFDDEETILTEPVAPISAILSSVPSKTQFARYPNLLTATTPFAFNTGSIEVRLALLKNATPGTYNYSYAQLQNSILAPNRNIANGTSAQNLESWNVLEYKIPYICDVPFVHRFVAPAIAPDITVVTLEYTGFDILKAAMRAGSDFQVMYTNVVPPYNNWHEVPIA